MFDLRGAEEQDADDLIRKQAIVERDGLLGGEGNDRGRCWRGRRGPVRRGISAGEMGLRRRVGGEAL